MQLYQGSKAFIQQFSSGIILECPSVEVVCVVPAAIRGTKFEKQDSMQNSSDDFLALYESRLAVTTSMVADMLYSRPSGIYRAGFLVVIADIARALLGINVWARLLSK